MAIRAYQDDELAGVVRELALEGYKGLGTPHRESREKYKWLQELGSGIWLDTGDLEAARKVWSSEVEALTTNNTLVNQVVQTGKMDSLIPEAAKRIRAACPNISDKDLVIEIAFLINARLALTLVQELGARVSVELHPDVGFDVTRTIAYARRYYEINPDFFYIKVPLTPDGFISVRQLSDEGIPVNFTLGFSARQNYLAARFSRPRFVNVFLGRLNQVVEENNLGKPENIGEKVGIASYEEIKYLRESARVPTQQIAASMRSGKQVAMLAGVDVLTIPPKAAAEYLELEIAKDDIRCWRSAELEVDLQAEKDRVASLWQVDERFIAFVDDVISQADQMKTGYDLVELSDKHGVNLFKRWTNEERLKIREKGKIPIVSAWPDAPIDDLMSMSALESFTKDQMELDSRIAGLIHG